MDETDGPTAHGDPMGTPAADERVLWRGRPDVSVLARTAFHTRKVGLYFLLLIGIGVATGNNDVAIVCTMLGLAAMAILHGLAWVCTRTTMYILTEDRLIMRIGMALETRINIPLKHVTSANLRMRGKDHGDIALQIKGERLLGFFLLWPHTRPWHFSAPEPMMRALPQAEKVAQLLAEACAKVSPAEAELSQIKDSQAERGMQANGPAAPAPNANAKTNGKASSRSLSDKGLSDKDLKGAPA